MTSHTIAVILLVHLIVACFLIGYVLNFFVGVVVEPAYDERTLTFQPMI